jgi:hypothetical protein
LPVLDVGVADVGEDAALGRLLDEVGVAGVPQDDDRAGRFDLVHLERLAPRRRAAAHALGSDADAARHVLGTASAALASWRLTSGRHVHGRHCVWWDPSILLDQELDLADCRSKR